MKLHCLIVFLHVIYCLPHSTECSPNYIVTGRVMNCTILSSQIVHNVTCDFTNYNRTHYMWNHDIFFKPKIKLDNFYAKVSLSRRPSSNRPFAVLMGMSNTTMDICALASGRTKSIYKNIFFDDVKKYSNFLNPCPRSGHIYVKDWLLNHGSYPPIVPLGEYKIQAIIYTIKNNDEIAVYQLNYSAKIVPSK